MRITKKLLTRLEGEVQLKLVWDEGKIKDAFVIVPHFRGFEKVLEGKPHLDALVITPRVCGICGHAHLIATVRAVEDAYKNAGIEFYLTEKAKTFREITLLLEILQNHVKWFYLYFFPDFLKYVGVKDEDYRPFVGKRWSEAIKASNLITKALATLAGQWPHNSYAVPGGITSDLFPAELVRASSLIKEFVKFLEERVFGIPLRELLNCKTKRFLEHLRGDAKLFLEKALEKGLDRAGRSYANFLTGGSVEPLIKPCVKKEKTCKFHPEWIEEKEDFSYFGKNGYTWSKAPRYRGLPYETGPLPRQYFARNPRVLYLYRNFKDSLITRVYARLEELAIFSLLVLEKVESLDLFQKSWIRPPVNTKELSGRGYGIVEAARGTLIHEVEIEKGVIKRYNIITPTAWNLGPRDEKFLGVAEKALIGLESEELAYLVLRGFDVCSVCTAH